MTEFRRALRLFGEMWNSVCKLLGMSQSALTLRFKVLRGRLLETAGRLRARTAAALDNGGREDVMVLGGLVSICAAGMVIFGDAEQPLPVMDAPVLKAERAFDVALGVPDLLKPNSAALSPYNAVETVSYAPREEESAAIAPRPEERAVPQDKQIPTSKSFITLFGDGASNLWFFSNWKTGEGALWHNDWSKEQSDSSSEGLTLAITQQDERKDRWTSGEVSTVNTYGYGRYEVIMKPAKGSGLVSSFFTYTGPYFGDPHDEIDIEFLGKDTRRVEFNTYQNGKARYGTVLDLPFDAAEEFHLYAFEWRPEGITWFIDGNVVHSTPEAPKYIPTTPGKIMMNVWTGMAIPWHGKPTFKSGETAEYACVSYRPLGEKARSCADFYTEPKSGGVRLASN